MKSKFENLLKTVRGEEQPTEPPARTTVKAKLARKILREPEPVAVLAQPDETKRRGRPPAKHSDPDFVQATAYIRKETHRDVKIELLKEEPPLEFSELVEQLLADWLNSKK